jgi:hypothetical protein
MADPNGHNTRLPAGALFSTAFPNVGVAAGGLDSTGLLMVPLNLDASGNLRVSTTSGGGGAGTQSHSATITAVAATTGAVQFLANNTARIGAAAFNNGAGTIYLLLGTGTVTTTGFFTVQMIPNAYYEVPFGFLGPVSGIWSTANGTAQVTEFT